MKKLFAKYHYKKANFDRVLEIGTDSGSSLSLSMLKKCYEHPENHLKDRFALLATERYPKNSFGYFEYAKILAHKGELGEALAMLDKAPKTGEVSQLIENIKGGGLMCSVQAREWTGEMNSTDMVSKYLTAKLDTFIGKLPRKALVNVALHLKYAEALKNAGKARASLESLTISQKSYVGERRILFKIAEHYKSNKQTQLAYTHMLLGESVYPKYGAVKRLSFEVDAEMYEEAEETFERILKFEESDLLKYLSVLNRVSPYVSISGESLPTLRESLRDLIHKREIKTEEAFNETIYIALKNRWYKEALDCSKCKQNQKFKLSDKASLWLNKVNTLISLKDDEGNEPLTEILKVASYNEYPDNLYGWSAGCVLDLKDSQEENLKAIELFIPNVFFTDPTEEKPSFRTVSKVYIEIIKGFISSDYIIIPRHQYNWRYCNPKSEFHAISYHTNTSESVKRLHIQESTLSGYCSLDTKGYAGFCSLSDEPQAIKAALEEVSVDEVNNNAQELYEEYVVKNVSKYDQASESFEVNGDYIFLPLQVLTDAVATLAHLDGVTLLKVVAEHYRGTGMKVVVKRHPFCSSQLMQSTVEELLVQGDIVESNASIHTIIAKAKAVITVNSGVGLESFIHGVPVITCGKSEYRYGVLAEAKSKKDIVEALNSLEKCDTLSAQREYLYFFVNNYLVDGRNAYDQVIAKMTGDY